MLGETSLFQLAWRDTRRAQCVLLGLSLAVLPLVYLVLEIPKHVINHALDSGVFEPVALLGLELDQRAFLLALCASFLLCVALQALLKFCLNWTRAKLAEGQLYRLRKLGLARLEGAHSAQRLQLIPVLARELEVIAGFVSELLMAPLFQGGIFITTLLFLFAQNVLLGTVALLLLPLQLLLIPRLQRRINRLNRQRAVHLRSLSEQMGEQVVERVSRADELSASIVTLRDLRLQMSRRKYLIKSFYNFSNQLTPLAFYALGGSLVLRGELSLGALVAALAAHKDFAAPLKELFSFYQSLQDARVRWRALTELAIEEK